MHNLEDVVPPSQFAGTNADSAPFLTHFFDGLRKEGVDFLVLRNYAELPYCAGNDLDILINSRQRAEAEAILILSARLHGYSLVNRAEFSPVSLFVAHPETRQQLQIDLFTGLEWRGFSILGSEAVLAARQDKGLFFAPHPIHEATLNLLTRLLYHGYVKEKYKPSIRTALLTEPGEARRTLAKPFGVQAADDLVACVLAEDWAAIEAESGRWRRQLVIGQLSRSPWQTLSSLLLNARRLVRRFAVPPGLMLVMLGPDGCGKSSVAAGIMEKLSPTFAPGKSGHFHWKPSFFRRGHAHAAPVTDPHGKPPRRPLTSLAYFAFHWLEFVVSGPFRLRPVLFGNGLAIVDRYYHDFFVDPQRYRIDIPSRLLDWAYRFVMKPDLVICLDVPTEVLQSRKQEVPVEESDRQRQAYLELARTLPNAHVVDASRPLDEVVAEVEGIVLDYMADRTARRLGLGGS